MRESPQAFAALLMSAAILIPAGAQARAVCEQLRHELNAGTETIGTTRQSRRLANTINQINRDIRQIRSELRRAGCSSGSVTVYGGENDAFCAAAEDDLRQAEISKQAMLERRASLDVRDQGDIIAALRRNGCGDEEMAEPAPVDRWPPDDALASRDEGIDERGYGLRDFGAIDRQPNDMLRLDAPLKGGAPLTGNLRTVCVRTCDGGFFPISANASPVDFSRDAATCSKMCPGTQTELFYHPMLDQDTSEMISVATGQPYKALSTAFAYRSRTDTKNSSCTCDLNAYYRDALKKQDGGAPSPDPVSRPRTETPEKSVTQIPAARDSAKPPAATAAPTTPENGSAAKITLPDDRPYDPKQSKVRQVGPQFLGDDSAGIDLKNPKGSTAQPLQ